MPAVTADPLSLPRISPAQVDQRERPVVNISTGPTGLEGLGFPVRRALAGASYQLTDPFIMMDHLGEIDYEIGEPKGTDWHPHRGFETVTYLMDGSFQHQDSSGGGGLIEPGDTQWMTAGSGILHIETPPASLVDSGGLFNGVQIWVNLPAAAKAESPAYQAITKDDILLLTSPGAGAIIRVIAGEVDGHRGPGTTHTPITILHASIHRGERLSLPWHPSFNALAYVFAGSGSAGITGEAIRGGNMVVFGGGDRITLSADDSQDSRTDALEVMILGGEPIGEPAVQYGPFVMNTEAEINRAIEDYQSGRMGEVPPGALKPHVYRG